MPKQTQTVRSSTDHNYVAMSQKLNLQQAYVDQLNIDLQRYLKGHMIDCQAHTQHRIIICVCAILSLFYELAELTLYPLRPRARSHSYHEESTNAMHRFSEVAQYERTHENERIHRVRSSQSAACTNSSYSAPALSSYRMGYQRCYYLLPDTNDAYFFGKI